MTYTFRTYSIYLIVSVYCCSIFLPYVVHAQTWADVSQETNQKQINYLQEKANQTISFPDTDISSTNDITQIVSLFVDSDIYDNISDDIERYATKYIQQKLPRTKVLVIPLNKNIKPENIALINDNLYHDGIKGKSSRLVGTIVIGGFTLPKVRNQYKFISSVYPWVDFEDVQFPWNQSGQKFEFAQNTHGQAEIRHGIIDYGNKIQDYRFFFQKLKTYFQDPLAYTSRRIWVDDFVKLKKSYDSSKLLGYINNFLYAEDKSYHRFTPILASLLQTGQTQYDSQVTADYIEEPKFDLSAIAKSDALGKLYQYNFMLLSGMTTLSGISSRYAPSKPTFVGGPGNAGVDYTEQFDSENNRIKNIIRDAKENNEMSLGLPDETMFRPNNIPTKFLGISILKYFHPYHTLFADTYLNNIYENTDAGGRYLNSKLGAGEVDSHIRYVTLKDEVSVQTIRDLNDIMEQALDRKIEKEKYTMNIPLLDLARVYQHCTSNQCVFDPISLSSHWLRGYEQFFFGKNALDIIQASETTIFRGSFSNINFLSSAQKLPLHGKILGGGYHNLTATETACHLGYNFQKNFINADYEQAKYCGDEESKINRYMKYVWGNMTPLNINQESTDQIRLIENDIDPMLAWNPSFDKTIGRSQFDLASCMATSGDMIFGKTDEIHDGYDQIQRLPFSYTGYSDTYLAADYFGSLTRTQNTELCNLSNVDICNEDKKTIHSGDIAQLYNNNFFTLIEQIIPAAKQGEDKIGFRIHAKKGFKTHTLDGGFFYHTPLIEKNQPIYVAYPSGNILLGVLSFSGISETYSGDLYPSIVPKFVPSPITNWDPLIPGSLEDEVLQMFHSFIALANSVIGDVLGIGENETLGSNPYMTLIDGNQCNVPFTHKKLYQHFYKTIDSRIYHKSPTDGELESMNTTTLARPVDDPRYISFKGIGGSTVRFLYPNLYEVPVEGNVTIENIKTSLIAYLQKKAKEQKEILQSELLGSVTEYTTHQVGYDLLKQIDVVATPLLGSGERTYQILDQDFYLKALGTTGLAIAAENLYYQLRNWPGHTNQTFSTVGAQIDWMKKNFSFNKKIEYIMGAYLTHDPKEEYPGTNAIRKNIIGLNDGYRQQGYEVAIINSDGNDYTLTANPLASQYPKGINRETQNNKDGTAGNMAVLDAQDQFLTGQNVDSGITIPSGAIAHDVLCGDQKYGSVVSLPKWPKALKCRLEETLKSPISLTINFKGAKGPVITDQIQVPYTKDTSIGDYAQITDKINKLGGSERMKIDNPWKQYVGRQHENTSILLKADQDSKNFGLFVEHNILLTNTMPIIDLTDSDIFEDGGSMGMLQLDVKDTTQAYGNVDIKIYSTGDTCIKVFDQSTCEVYEMTHDFMKPLNIPFKLGTQKVGNTIVDIAICSNPQICYYKTINIEAISSQVDHITFKLPADTLTLGYQTPLIIYAFDKYGNRIHRTPHQYRLLATGADILQGKQIFTNFDDALYLITPRSSFRLTLQKNLHDSLQFYTGQIDPYQTIGSVSVNAAKPKMISNLHPISISRLGSIPGNEYQYLIIKGIPWALLEVESLSGLFEPGIFKISTGISTPSFVATKDFEIKDMLTIPLKPTYKAGYDQIRIRMKYDDGTALESLVSINIKPGFPYKINLNRDHAVIPRGSPVTGKVIITDMYGNIADMPVDVFITTQIPLCVPEQCDKALSQDGLTFDTVPIIGTGIVTLDTYQGSKDGMGGQAIAQLKMLGFASQQDVHQAVNSEQSGAEKIHLNYVPQEGEQTNTSLTVEYKGMTSKTLRPLHQINVMYLTLMGSGRSNYQYTLFTESNKLLALTTVIGTDDIIDSSYKSIQDSKDTKLDIGFDESFKHITEFSQGHIVGESTRGFGSYRLVNYGDPVLTRIDENRIVNNTSYDASIGKYIHSYPGQMIKQTDEVDFDGDGLKDIVVMMTDGVVRFLKNYLKNPIPGAPGQYHDIGMIGRIGDGLIETKANPDGLFLRSQNGKIRKYPFGGTRMAIDGELICLDIPGGPELSPLYRVPQIHFIDLDLKGGTDILTSDYLGRIIATYSNTAFNPITLPVQDITPFVGPGGDLPSYENTIVSQTGGLMSGIRLSQMPYKYKITISNPDPLHIDYDTIYIKHLGSLSHTSKLKYILDVSDGRWKASTIFTGGIYYAAYFDDIKGIQPIFEDLPYTTDTPFGHSYISSSKFYCDRWRKYRQHQAHNSIIIEQAAINIKSGNDQSLTATPSHGNEDSLASYENNPQKELNMVDATIYQSKYAGLMAYPSSPDENTLFVPTLNDTNTPLLEGPSTKAGAFIPSPIPGDSKYYCPISICRAGVSKSVIGGIKPGDYATIKVSFSKPTPRYIENLQGPWKILREADGKPLNYRSDQKTGTMIPYFDDLPGGYVLYIDHILPLQRFSYTAQYVGADLFNIVPEYLNCDLYPDLKVAGHNGCNKNINYYLNQGNARVKKSFDLTTFIIDQQIKENKISDKILSGSYTEVALALKSGHTTQTTLNTYNFGESFGHPLVMIENEYESHPIDGKIPLYIPQDEENGQTMFQNSDTSSTTPDLLKNVTSVGSGLLFSTLDVLNHVVGVSQTFAQGQSNDDSKTNSFQRFRDTANQRTNYGNITLNLDLSRQATQNLQKGIDKVLKDLCNGFQVGPGGTCPKPFQMPFNMAFLAPGTYNFMGKKLMEDQGLPIFFFPGTLYLITPIPIPYGLKSPSDAFYRIDGGSIPSFIRLYLAPTITLGLGFGICFGVDKPLRTSLKKPFKDIVGNCIALATDLKPQCKEIENAGGVPSLDDSQGAHSYPITYTRPSNYIVSGRVLDLLTCPTCTYASPRDQLILHAESSAGDFLPQTSHISETMDDNDQRNIIAQGANIATHITNGIETNNDVNEKQAIKIEKVKEYSNKIKGGAGVGLMPAIQRWIEQQIEYIINNAMHLDVKIYTPDLGALTDGFDEVGEFAQFHQGIGSSLKKIKTDHPILKGDSGLGFARLGGQNLTQTLSDYSPNPFDALAKAFEHVSLFKFEQKDIQIKLPMIYSEDIARYTSYLKGWFANQEKIAQQRDDAIKSCKEGKGFQKIQNCDLIETRATKIKVSMTQLERAIKKNISTLEYYRDMPSKLTQYLNVHERYLAEITETYGNLIATVTNWMHENALRFEQWVDSLILLVGIIKTWQIIPDFALNRSEKCSKCTVDTYSYLSEDRGSLTPTLPILPIPPFRIPDIILDLSKITVGLTITLPHFTIVPTRVPLPQLPDLPSPFTVDLSAPQVALQIPQVPHLPELQLPPFELPSFVPQIELKLPLLPPAVKIPKINPGIRTIVKLVEFLGTLVCIYKRGFGLVGENSLKTKIEQMTQRNVDIFPFDSLIDLAPIPPLKGYDIKVDTFVNFAFNFEGVYDVFKSMADTINKVSDNFTASITRTTNKINEGGNYYNNWTQYIPDNLQFNYNYKLEDYQVVKKEMLEELDQIPSFIPLESQNNLANLKTLIKKTNRAFLNTTGFAQIAQQGGHILHNKIQEISKLKYAIEQNYQQFITDTPRYQFVSETSDQILSFNIFASDQDTVKVLEDMQHPDKIFLDLNQKYIQTLLDMTKYAKAEEFGRDNKTHGQIRKLLIDLNHGIDKSNESYRDEFGKHISPKLIFAQTDTTSYSPLSNTNNQNSGSGNTIGNTGIAYIEDVSEQEEQEEHIIEDDSNDEDVLSEEEIANLNTAIIPEPFVPVPAEDISQIENYTDPTNQIQGYFAPSGPVCKDDPYFGLCSKSNVCTDDRYNIIDKPGTNISLYKSQPHSLTPKGSPFVLHDDMTIFAKTAGPEHENDVFFTDFYELPSFDSIEDLTDDTQEGFILVDGDRYKIWDQHFHIYDFQAKGQNYENLSFQWTNVGYDGYIVRVTDRVDIFPDKLLDNKQSPNNFDHPSQNIKYILVLPYGVDLETLRLSVVGEFAGETVQSLKDQNILLAIQYFKPQDQVLSVILANLPAKRYYTQVRGMEIQDKNIVGLFFSTFIDSTHLKTSSPRSTQQMGGMQIVSDNEPPTGVFNLIRKKTGMIEGTGLMLDGVIMTHYKIIGTWDDNTKVMYSWINHEGKLIKKVPGNRIEIDDLYFTGGFNKTFEFGAMDSAGMVTVEQVVMDVTVPDIEIININNYGSQYTDITAEINRDMDEGSVKFERLRNILWTSLKDIDGRDLYPLVPGQTVVTGGLYDLMNSYDLLDSSGDTILSIDPQYPNIVLPESQQESYQIDASLNLGKIGINIKDKKNNQTIFTYYPVSQSLSDHQALQITSPQYQAIPLSNTSNLQLNGGTCIAQVVGECQIVIDKNGNPLIPPPYNQTLSMNYVPGSSGQAIYQFVDPNNNPIANVTVVLKPLD